MSARFGVAPANCIGGGSSGLRSRRSQSAVHTRILAVASASAIFFFVAARSIVTEFNPDYSNYEVIIAEVQRSEDVFFSLFLAKDLSFFLFIKLGAIIQEGTLAVFALVAFATFIAKIAITAKAIRKPFLFALLYAILLAPGLDLAAIRACLALSLLGLALASETRRGMVIFYLSALLSHVSILAAVLAILQRVCRWVERKPWVSQLSFVCVALVVYPVVSIFERSADYDGNASSAFGLIFAVLTPVAVNVSRLLTATRRHTQFSQRCLGGALIVASLGFGLAPVAITISTRMSEIATFLLLLCLCSAKNGYRARFWIPVAALSIFPILRNTMSGLWISLVM